MYVLVLYRSMAFFRPSITSCSILSALFVVTVCEGRCTAYILQEKNHVLSLINNSLVRYASSPHHIRAE